MLTVSLQQSYAQDPVVKVYKKVDTVNLNVKIYYPGNQKPQQPRPAIIFFFGGGWVGGSMQQFAPHSKHYAEKDMIAITAEYRVKNRHGTSPLASIADAKSAIRWVRKNADNLGVDPEKIVGAGGSAGGHLAASTAMISDFNDPDDDLAISPVPNALVLFNPVVNTTEEGYGAGKLGANARGASPYHHIRKDLPPTIIFHGTDDTTVPVENVKDFCVKMEKFGNQCNLHTFEGQEHAFFNYGKDGGKYYRETVALADRFLNRLGYF